MLTEIISIASFIIASGALTITILNFKRQRTIENENFIYKSKIEVYNNFTTEINRLIKCYQKAYVALTLHDNGSKVLTRQQLIELANQIDNCGYKLEDIFAENQLLLTESVSEKIESFIDDFIYRSNETTYDAKLINDLLKDIYVDAQDLINIFRVDLNIDRINQSLFRRLK